MTIAMLIILFAIKIVARRNLGCSKWLIIILSCVLLDSFIFERSDGFNEKNATSEAETNPDDKIKIIQNKINK